MSAPSSVQGAAGIRVALVDELLVTRTGLVGPDRKDPALGRPLSVEDDAVQMCAAVYALPSQFRETGKSGIPLMWAWPWDLYQQGLARREELLLAAALLLSAVDRNDPAQLQHVRHLQTVATHEVGRKPADGTV